LADIFAWIFYGIKMGGGSLNEHFCSFFTSMTDAPKLVSMVYALLYVGVLFIPAYFLHKKNIFIKL
jgi:hypothetical protein